MRIGILSDTHGLLRPEVLPALRGVSLILHAGDVGDPQILTRLREIAPVFAVRGNVDVEDWATDFPATTVVEAGGASFYMLHNLRELNLNPKAAGFDAVISGHTHQREEIFRDGVLYLNPGSVGPRRFSLPITMATLDISKKPWQVQWHLFG